MITYLLRWLVGVLNLGRAGKIKAVAASRFAAPKLSKNVRLGYNDVFFPQSQIAVSKLLVYPESYSEGKSIIDSMGLIRNKEDTKSL